MPPGRIGVACSATPGPHPLACCAASRPGTQQRRCRRPGYRPAQPARHETGRRTAKGQAELAVGAVTVVADLTPTTLCDTAGVREMQLAYWSAAVKGIELRVVVPSRLMLQFTWTGLDRVLAVYPSVSAAVAAAGQTAGD
jgi:hypothetical protein